MDATYLRVKDDLGAFSVHATSGVLFLQHSIDAEKHFRTEVEVSATVCTV